MDIWIRHKEGRVNLIRYKETEGLIKLTVTSQQEQQLISGQLLYQDGELVSNPNYVEVDQNAINEQKEKKEFGQNIIAKFQAESDIEGIFNSNPVLAQQLIAMTSQLFDALNAGWLLMADSIIKALPENSLNEIISAALLLRYRNEIRAYMNLEPVETYNA